MTASPTTRSLNQLRADGYLAEKVEHWNHHAGIRQDLFGFVDIVALGPSNTNEQPHVLFVQTTTGDNVSTRVRKIGESPHIARCREAGIWVHVHGWRKNAKGRWELRIVDCS